MCYKIQGGGVIENWQELTFRKGVKHLTGSYVRSSGTFKHTAVTIGLVYSGNEVSQWRLARGRAEDVWGKGWRT